jgi:pentatricopeptide repeat protein
MICGYCREFRTKRVEELFLHLKTAGCHQDRRVWERVLEAHKRGTSGRRILSEAFPDLYPSTPMPEETKAKLREINETRKAQGIKMPKRRRVT